MIAKLLGLWMLFSGLVVGGSFVFDYNAINFFEETLGFRKLRELTMKVIQEPWGEPVLVGDGKYEWEYPDKYPEQEKSFKIRIENDNIHIQIP